MKRSSPLLALLLLACAREGTPQIQLQDAWARAPAAGGGAAAYMTITNSGTADDALLDIASNAGSAQVHSTSMADGIMRMRKLDRLEVPAGETVKLEPGGTHVMLTGLGKPLEPGGRIELTVRFEKSQQQRITTEVRPVSGEPS